jgi:hypothetical protein
MEDYNPRLRAAYLEAVETQLKSGEPPETKETYARLRSEGFSDEEARVLLAQVIAVESYCVLKEKKPFNRARFVRNLNALPAQPQEQP